jgi:lipoprotein-anchoring transpeptidase ErfK/SrfK
MVSLFLSFLIAVVSPVWPIGDNPLPGDPYIIVNKTKNQLAYVEENKIMRIVPVATGKSEELTPEGEFTITVKAKDPYYRKKNIPGGHKDNPLGSRWIGFDAKETDGRTYGLHGTNNPTSVGKYITAGCVRLYDQDIKWLYDKTPIGTKVLITRSKQDFYTIAKQKGAIK